MKIIPAVPGRKDASGGAAKPLVSMNVRHLAVAVWVSDVTITSHVIAKKERKKNYKERKKKRKKKGK
jgi:hypothetical protein